VRASDDYESVRALAATYMLSHAADFAPFMPDVDDYAEHCRRVRHCEGDQVLWGTGNEVSKCVRTAYIEIDARAVSSVESRDPRVGVVDHDDVRAER